MPPCCPDVATVARVAGPRSAGIALPAGVVVQDPLLRALADDLVLQVAPKDKMVKRQLANLLLISVSIVFCSVIAEGTIREMDGYPLWAWPLPPTGSDTVA